MTLRIQASRWRSGSTHVPAQILNNMPTTRALHVKLQSGCEIEPVAGRSCSYMALVMPLRL